MHWYKKAIVSQNVGTNLQSCNCTKVGIVPKLKSTQIAVIDLQSWKAPNVESAKDAKLQSS